MGDEVLAGLAPLVGVVLAGEYECVFDAVAIDLNDSAGGVLGDDRKQVVEQPLLGVA
jgi:cephalosporin hydroxylase